MRKRQKPDTVVVNRSIIMGEDNRLLLVRRSTDDNHNPGLWEFPGGKVEKGQDLSSGLTDEIDQETGLRIESVSPLVYPHDYIIEDGKYEGSLYVALFSVSRVVGGELRLSHEHEEYAWEMYGRVFSRDLTVESEKALRFLGPTVLAASTQPVAS